MTGPVDPEIVAPRDWLESIPMLFGADAKGAPTYPDFNNGALPKYDLTFSLGPATLRELGRAMMDIKHGLTLRGYCITASSAQWLPPAIVTPDDDRHAAEFRIRFRGCVNEAEKHLLYHELGVISAAQQWARAQEGKPKLVLVGDH